MKTKMHSKAILALLLSVIMVISMIPAAALPVKAVEYTEGDSFYYSGFDDTTKWTRVNATIADGVATFAGSSARLSRSYSSTAVEKDFTLKFSIHMPNESNADVRAYIELGTGEEGNSTFGILFLCGRSGVVSDRVRVYKGNTSTGSQEIFTLEGTKAWHDIQIDVSPKGGTYSVTVDGKAIILADGSTEILFEKDRGFQSVYFRPTSGTVNIKNFEIYTSDMEGAYDWTVTKQAALGKNIGFTFSGEAGSMTGIKSVRATVGTTVVTEAVGEDGAYSVTLPVAASQMGEAITLEGLNAEGTALQTKTYTVAEYLAEVKASDEAAYGSIVDHTLNYGSAAAAYFDGTAVTAPEGLTLSDVPDARKGDNITLTSDASSEESVLSFRPAGTISGGYTVEFDYQPLSSNANFTLKVGPGYQSTKSNLWVRVRTGQSGTVYHTSSSTIYETDAKYGEANKWHHCKVTAYKEGAVLKFKVWLDNEQIISTEYPDGGFPCFSAQSSTLALDTVTFSMPTGGRTVMIDDFVVYSGDGSGEPYYSDNFETFQTYTAKPSGKDSWVTGVGSTTLNYQELENPVSGSCTGVTVNSANLLFEDQVKVRYKITLGDGKNIENYTIKVNGSDPAKTASAGGNSYYIYSAGINPQMYGTDVVLTVSDGTDTVTVNYSALDYIQRMSAKEDTKAELKTLLKAMYNYYQAANTYLAN